MYTTKNNNYIKINNTILPKPENFFVRYAVRGPIIYPEFGLEAGMPVNHPIKGPVKEPSPLNTRWIYEKGYPVVGVL